MGDTGKMAKGQTSTLYLIHILTHATRSILDDQLKPNGVTAFHYTILRVISDNAGLSAAALSRRFYVTPQTMGEMLIMLERKGLLDRLPNPNNQRSLALHLTEEGKETVSKGDKLVAQLEARMFADADPGDSEQLRAIVSRAIGALREVR